MLRRCLLSVFPLVFLAGCGGQEKGFRFAVHPADGTVKAGGKPVPRAIVRFHPVDPSKVEIPPGQTGPAVMLTTETDAEGAFVMSTYLADDGVPAGDYKVTVAQGAADVDVENADGPVRRPSRPASSLAYRDPEKTPLKATVRAGEVNHFDFEVE